MPGSNDQSDDDKDKDKDLDNAEAGDSDSEDKKDDDSDKSDKGDDDASDKSDKDKSGTDSKDDDDEEPPKRKSTRDFILERKAKAHDKAKKKSEEEDEDDDDEDTDKVTKAATKAVEPVMSLLRKQADDSELQEVFINHPDAKKDEKLIRKLMGAYKDAPVEFIYYSIIGKRNELAAKKAKADQEAEENKTGGNARRSKDEGKIKSAWDLSESEFEKEVAKTMASQQ